MGGDHCLAAGSVSGLATYAASVDRPLFVLWLDAHPDIMKAQVLITEMTFFRPDHRKEKIHKFGHMHLDDILDRADRFENELVILSHLSTRTHEGQARQAIKNRLPDELQKRVMLWC